MTALDKLKQGMEQAWNEKKQSEKAQYKEQMEQSLTEYKQNMKDALLREAKSTRGFIRNYTMSLIGLLVITLLILASWGVMFMKVELLLSKNERLVKQKAELSMIVEELEALESVKILTAEDGKAIYIVSESTKSDAYKTKKKESVIKLIK